MGLWGRVCKELSGLESHSGLKSCTFEAFDQAGPQTTRLTTRKDCSFRLAKLRRNEHLVGNVPGTVGFTLPPDFSLEASTQADGEDGPTALSVRGLIHS